MYSGTGPATKGASSDDTSASLDELDCSSNDVGAIVC